MTMNPANPKDSHQAGAGTPAPQPADDVLQAEANIGKEPTFFQYASEEERDAHERALLERSQAQRRELLSDTYSASEVAALLDETIPAVIDHAGKNELLAIADAGELRFPRWQFDKDGAVPIGLADVLNALADNGVSAYRQAKWLQRKPDYFEDGSSPFEKLKEGEIHQVLLLARSVGLK